VLIFKHVSDTCSARAHVLDNNAFPPLTDESQLIG
jgi:hypothetical protein